MILLENPTNVTIVTVRFAPTLGEFIKPRKLWLIVLSNIYIRSTFSPLYYRCILFLTWLWDIRSAPLSINFLSHFLHFISFCGVVSMIAWCNVELTLLSSVPLSVRTFFFCSMCSLVPCKPGQWNSSSTDFFQFTPFCYSKALVPPFPHLPFHHPKFNKPFDSPLYYIVL